MDNIICDFSSKVKVITPNDEYHYFFGYYDMRATGDGINQKHLCHRVKFMDRLPNELDVCEVGYLEDNKFYKIGETTAWNFQQGAMLQYHPFKENTVYYNVCLDGEFKMVTHNFVTGEKSYTDMATACVSSNGKYGLSVNFGRIFAFRPGYGYAGYVDKNKDINVPSDDGVFLTDMILGKSRLIISYKDLLSESGFTNDDKVLVNHITFAPNSNKFLMLVRNFPEKGKFWSTSMMIGDINGNFKTVLKNTYVSHYKWIDDDKVVVHCNVYKENPKYHNLYVINVNDGTFEEYDHLYQRQREYQIDIHCSLSPDGKYIIGDGYPRNGYRDIVVVDYNTKESKTILSAKTVIPTIGDIRCDLHARYVFNGEYVSFDSTHNDKREIVVFPASEVKAK